MPRRANEPQCGGKWDSECDQQYRIPDGIELAAAQRDRGRRCGWQIPWRRFRVSVLGQSAPRRGIDRHLVGGDLLDAGISEKVLANHAYVRRAALLDGIDEFDADFFGFTPQAARMTDPQHRLFLQSAWHALEDAGYDPAQIDGSVGVYGTSSTSGYLLHNLMSHHDPNAIIGQGVTFEMVNLSLQNDKDHLATRVAHQFNLRGPALSVQTACSSSLVAVHLACQSILNGECEMALAGGASIRVPHRVGYWHEPGSMVSATGHCRPFDVRADGTIFGSGVGIVVAQVIAGRSRRRGPHSRRDPRIGDQQRRIDEDELRRAQCGRSG